MPVLLPAERNAEDALQQAEVNSVVQACKHCTKGVKPSVMQGTFISLSAVSITFRSGLNVCKKHRMPCFPVKDQAGYGFKP